jgi:hypothetical protein
LPPVVSAGGEREPQFLDGGGTGFVPDFRPDTHGAVGKTCPIGLLHTLSQIVETVAQRHRERTVA